MNYSEKLQRAMSERWYVVVNDVVGGWAVTNLDRPLSHLAYGGPVYLAVIVAETTTKYQAEYIVGLHNKNIGLGEEDDS